MRIQEILVDLRKQQPSGVMRDLLLSKGLLSSTDVLREEIQNRLDNEDLVFFPYVNWHLFLNENGISTIDDSFIYYTDRGVFSSMKIIENKKMPKTLITTWFEEDSIWQVKSIMIRNKAKDLLTLIRGSEITPVDEKLTGVLVSIQGFGVPKTIKLLNSVMDDLVNSASKASCLDDGIPFDKDVHDKLVVLQGEFDNVIEQLESILI